MRLAIMGVMGIYGSSGHAANPLGTVGLLTGAIAAAFSVMLWFHYFQPEATILGTYSPQLAPGGALVDQIKLLATLFGLMALLTGIGGGLGGKGGAGTVGPLLLGVIGLSYPVLTALSLIDDFVPNPVGG